MKAYTDGACSGNPGPGGWAIQIHHPDGYLEEFGGREEELTTTNNRMELLAVIKAMEYIRNLLETAVLKSTHPEIFTDSVYVCQASSSWLPLWRQRGFYTRNGEKVKNRDLWEYFLTLEPQHFRLRWVQGHDGNIYQERVDQLATDLARGRPVWLFSGYPPEDHCTYPLYLIDLGDRVERVSHWTQCQRLVHGRSGVRFRKVRSPQEACQVLHGWGYPWQT